MTDRLPLGHKAEDFSLRDYAQVNIGDHHEGPTIVTGNTFVWHSQDVKSQTVFDWFSTIKYWLHHQTMRADILLGSGEWIHEKEEFASWISASQTSVLWIHGIPGCGKSKLVARIIDHVKPAVDLSAGILAYFYCARDAAEANRSYPQEVIRCILRQLSFAGNENKILKPPAMLQYNAKKVEAQEYGSNTVDRLSWTECVDLLVDLLNDQTTYVIVDAVDELKEQDRWYLFQALDEVLERVNRGVVRILFLSRNSGDIKNKLSSFPNVEIDKNENQGDIDQFVQAEVKRAIACGRIFDGRVSKQLRGDIIDTLVNGAKGMFRWVSLQIEALCCSDIGTEMSLRETLGSLPPTLEMSYEDVYAQILGKRPRDRKIAENSLRWLLCGKHQLKSSAFIQAVLYSEGKPDKLDHVEPESLLNLCCNLIVLDPNLDIFRLAHLSVREYLEKKAEYEKFHLHTMATKACVSTIISNSKILTSLNRRRSSETIIDSITRQVEISGNFFLYAIYCFPKHCEESGPQDPKTNFRRILVAITLPGNETEDTEVDWQRVKPIVEILQILRHIELSQYKQQQVYDKLMAELTSQIP